MALEVLLDDGIGHNSVRSGERFSVEDVGQLDAQVFGSGFLLQVSAHSCKI